MTDSLGPCTLDGTFVRLEPLSHLHLQGLLAASQDSDFTWLRSEPKTEAGMVAWIEEQLKEQERGTGRSFTVFTKNDGHIVGSTGYLDIRPSMKGVEIGMTWYTSKVWGTVVNPECKFLLLQHGFEDWGAIRVQLKTDNNNLHSQRAISKLGAKFEGRLRNHRLRRDGSLGDSMMYSITIEDWNQNVRDSLHRRIDRFAATT